MTERNLPVVNNIPSNEDPYIYVKNNSLGNIAFKRPLTNTGCGNTNYYKFRSDVPDFDCYKVDDTVCVLEGPSHSIQGSSIWTKPDENGHGENNNIRSCACQFKTKDIKDQFNPYSANPSSIINSIYDSYGVQGTDWPEGTSDDDKRKALTSALNTDIIPSFCELVTTNCVPDPSTGQPFPICSMFNSADTTARSICNAYAKDFPSKADAIKTSYCDKYPSSNECSCILRETSEVYEQIGSSIGYGSYVCWYKPCATAGPSSGYLSTSDTSSAQTTQCPSVCQAVTNLVASNNSTINVGSIKNQISCDLSPNTDGGNGGSDDGDTDSESTWSKIKAYISTHKKAFIIGSTCVLLGIIILIIIAILVSSRRKRRQPV